MRRTITAALATAFLFWGTTVNAQEDQNTGGEKPKVERSGPEAKKDGDRPGRRWRGLGQPGQPGKPGDPQTMQGQILDALIKRLDANEDGVVSIDEVPERAMDRMAKIDANSDGKLDRSEFEQAMANMKGRARGMLGRRPGMGGLPGGDRPEGVDRIQGMLKRIDKDQDGSISIDEAPDRLKQRFDQLDANGDQKLDAQEIKAMAEKMRGAGGQGPGGKRRGGGDENQKPQRPKRPNHSDGGEAGF